MKTDNEYPKIKCASRLFSLNLKHNLFLDFIVKFTIYCRHVFRVPDLKRNTWNLEVDTHYDFLRLVCEDAERPTPAETEVIRFGRNATLHYVSLCCDAHAVVLKLYFLFA